MDKAPSRRSKITLRAVTEETVVEICSLNVKETQSKFVAPNALSIAQAHFSKHAWFRAIYARDIPVGFVMLHDDPDKPENVLWRFMIDQRYQGLGFGGKAMQLIIEHIHKRPKAAVFFTSVVQDEGGPQGFYEKAGFQLTGEIDDGEAVMKLTLSSTRDEGMIHNSESEV